MTSVSALPTAGYYQLSNNATSSGSNTPTDSLLAALNATSGANSSANSAISSSAYLLNLSPQAQQYMSSSSGSSSSSGVSSAISALNGTSGSSSFVLTTQQQQTITNIITKYKNAPYTQATFNQIQNDLNSAGLGTNQLSGKDKAQNFNATSLLIDDLNGNSSAATAMTSPDETSKSSNYMQQILSQWQTISGNTGTPAATNTATNTNTTTS